MAADSLVVKPTALVGAAQTPSVAVSGLTPDPALSGESVDVFDDASGNPHVAQFFTGPVNYQNAAGAWVPIQSQLVSDGSGGFRNAAAGFQLRFPGSWSSLTPVTFGQGAYSMAVSIEGQSATTPTESADSHTVIYAGVLSGVNVAFSSLDAGYRDVVTLENSSAPSTITYSVTTSGGLQLVSESDGSIGLVSASGAQVGQIPAPIATDAATNPLTAAPAQGPVSYALSGGNGSYQLALVVDPAWLASATYPVVIDPTVNPSDTMDTYVDSGAPNTAYGSAVTLDVKDVSGANAQHSFLLFPVSTWFKANRVVLGATVSAYPVSQANQNTVVNLKQITGGWGNSTTWNTQPSTSGTDDSESVKSGWFSFDATSAYQTIFDSQANSGVALETSASSSNNQVQFASSETTIKGAQPALTLQYDDPPSTPTLSSPDAGSTLAYDAPTLAVSGTSGDPNGDTVYMVYQVSTSSTDWSNPVATGTVDNGQSWTVPTGALKDGTTYYWRAAAWDGYSNPLCYSWSGSRSFTLNLPKFGDDSSYQMWSKSLGNGMGLNVNEATGNVYLSYPLDSIPTPAGELDINLAYNSLDSTSMGEGRGWVLSVGPASDPQFEPVSLAFKNSNAAALVTERDGSKVSFTNQDPTAPSTSIHSWIGSGVATGTITENNDGTPADTTYTYEPTDGGRYVFDSTGQLVTANPSTSSDAENTDSITYNYDPTSGRLTSVTEPFGREIDMTYNSAADNTTLESVEVKAPDGTSRSWTIGWDSTYTTMTSVTDPLGDESQFGYTAEGDGDTYVTSVTDAGANAGATADEWQIAYADPNYTSVSAPMMHAVSVTEPAISGQGENPSAIPATQFGYGSEQDGYVVNSTTLTDPNGNQTTTQFDSQGLPILIDAPQESINGTNAYPQTTMMWDSNGNLLCERGPAANAYYAAQNPGQMACVVGNKNPDGYETTYTYQPTAPFSVTQKIDTMQTFQNTGTGPTWNYTYENGITGLLQENFQSTALAGMPAAREEQENNPMSQNWGSTPPDGLSAGAWAVRWTGRLHVTQQGTYNFKVSAAGGVRLIVAGKVLLDCWQERYTYSQYNCNQGAPVHVEMWPADPQVVLEYHHFSGDTGHIDTTWDGGNGGGYSEIAGTNFDPGDNLLTNETDPSGLATSYTYTASDEPRDLVDQIQQVDQNTNATDTEAFTYDAWGRVKTDTKAPNSSYWTETSNTYQETTGGAQAGCLIQQVIGETATSSGTTKTYTCDWYGDITDETTTVPAVSGTQQGAATQETKTTYNQIGEPTLVEQDPTGADLSTATKYWPDGKVEQVTDPQGHVTAYTYTPRGQVYQETENAQDPASNQEVLSYVFDDDGNQTSVNKAWNGQSATWTSTYDQESRVKTSSVPAVSTPTTYAYDQKATQFSDDGFLTSSVTTSDGVTTTTTNSLRGQPLYTQVTGEPAASNTYNASDDLTATTTPNGVTTTNGYDQFGRKTSVTTDSGPTSPTALTGAAETVKYTWNSLNQEVSATDPESHQTSLTYDGLGDVASVTAPPPSGSGTSTWTFLYDAAGQRVEAQDPDGRVRDWAYNALGQLATSYEYPQTGTTLTTAYSYTPDGQLAETQPASGPNLCSTYDDYANQTSRYTVPSAQSCETGTQSSVESYQSSPLSGMTQAQEGASGPVVSITYDPTNPDRVSQVTEGSAKTVYTYNPSTGQVSSVADSIGSQTNQTSYAYNDPFGLVSSVTDPFTANATSYVYNPDGQVTQTNQANGRDTAYTYDSAARLVEEASTMAGQSPQSYALSYSDLGQVLTDTQSFPAIGGNQNQTGEWVYQYNPAGELWTSQFTPQGQGANPKTTYGYDGNGDRTSSQIGSGTPTTWSYDGADRLTSVGSTTYTWNDQNQLTGVGANTSYGYDAWGRLVTATVASTTVAYAYDALNRLQTSAISGGNTTSYTYTGTGQALTSSQAGSAAPTYYADNPDGSPLVEQQGAEATFLVQDPHGDLAGFYDPSGNPTGTTSYDPWGNPTTVGSAAQTSLLGYQSQLVDPTTGLVNMGARQYDPTQGRFTTQDTVYGSPTNPLTLNQYIYGDDSPIDNADPTGNYGVGRNSAPQYGGSSRADREYQDEQNQHYTTTAQDEAASDAGWNYDNEIANRMVHATPALPVAPEKPQSSWLHAIGSLASSAVGRAWNAAGGVPGVLGASIGAAGDGAHRAAEAVGRASTDLQDLSEELGGDARIAAGSVTLSEAESSLEDVSHGLLLAGVALDLGENLMHHNVWGAIGRTTVDVALTSLGTVGGAIACGPADVTGVALVGCGAAGAYVGQLAANYVNDKLSQLIPTPPS